MLKQITLTIDGTEITAPEGMLIVDAAKAAGIDIPVFCYHPKMEPVGMCRMCLVEVGRPMMDRTTGRAVLDDDGQPKLQFGPKLETACTTPISDGMVVLTKSEKAKAGQKSTVEFLLTSHPLDCPVCDKGGECPLQNLTMAHGPGESRFLFDEKMRLEKNVPLSELIYLDEERCIQCGRCVRFQDEIAGDPVLSFDERGRSMRIVSLSEPGFDSVFSGNTTDICPVGALTTADFRFGARPWELTSERVDMRSVPRGLQHHLQHAPGSRFGRTDRGEARDAAAERGSERDLDLRQGPICVPLRREPGAPEQAAGAQGGQAGTCFVGCRDADRRRCVHQGAEEPAGAGLGAALQRGPLQPQGAGGPNGREGRAVLRHGRRRPDHAARHGERFEPGFAAGGFDDRGGGLRPVRGGPDLVPAREAGSRTRRDPDRGQSTRDETGPLRVVRCALCLRRRGEGDPEPDAQRQDRRRIHAVPNSAVIFFGSEGLGLQGSKALASACARALHDTGHFGKPNSGLIGVWEYANHQGAAEIGFEPVDNLQAAFDGASAVYIAGADPIGDGAIKLRTGRRKPFLLVQDIFETETARAADVVLPAQTYMEREGTFTSAERSASSCSMRPFRRWRGPEPDFAITAQVARESGVILEGSSAAVVFDIMAAEEASPFARLSYARLADVHEQWPIVGRGDLYYGGTTYENTQGLGVQLFNASQRGEKVSLPRVRKAAALRPQEKRLLGVPVTKLYDRARTVASAEPAGAADRQAIRGDPPERRRELRRAEGERATVSLDGTSEEVIVKIDESISTGVALIPRSMGLPIIEPTPIRLKGVKKGAAR